MATAFDFDLAVIGGGAAGLTAVAGAARLGVKTLLVEKERLGGDCLHFGCVPSKALIATAKARHTMARAGDFGLPEVPLPPVDFSRVAERIASVIATIGRHDAVERFRALGAAVRFGAPRFVDDHVIELNGKRVSAARFVIATGSRAAVPAIPGLGQAGFLTNRDLFSLPALPASLVILGAGPIAVEMGQAFCRLGAKVTMLQRGDQILSREDKDVAGLLLARLTAEGVDVRLGVKVLRVEAAGGQKAVIFAGPAGEERTCAEAVLVALGRTANLEGLDLAAAGVTHTAEGVAVDSRLRSSAKHIFAAGDATGAHLFTHAAGYEAGVVLANAVFRLPKKTDYRRLPHATYTDPELASVGMNVKRAYAAGIDCRVVTEPFAGNDRALAEGAGEGLVKLVLDAKGKPLGAQILGPGAGELLSEWVAALAGKVGLATLAAAVHPYPTLSETSKRAAGSLLEGKLFSPTVKKGLALLFSYKGRACGEDGA